MLELIADCINQTPNLSIGKMLFRNYSLLLAVLNRSH